MQAAVDPDDRLAFARERTRLDIGHTPHERQPPGDVAIALETCEVGLGRDDRDQHLVAFRGVPRDAELHAVRGGVQALEVIPQLAEVCERVVVAGFEPEHRPGRRHHAVNQALRRRVPAKRRDEQKAADSKQLEDESSGFPGRHGARVPVRVLVRNRHASGRERHQIHTAAPPPCRLEVQPANDRHSRSAARRNRGERRDVLIADARHRVESGV